MGMVTVIVMMIVTLVVTVAVTNNINKDWLRFCTWSAWLARQESSRRGVHADPQSQA